MTGKKQKSSGVKGAVERAQDMAGGVAGMATAATAGASSNTEFVSNAVIGSAYELASSQMALERSHSDRIKALADKFIDDHLTASHQMQSTLRSIPDAPVPPTELDDRRAKMVDHLREAPDDEFDQRFLEQQMLAHEESLTLFEGFAQRGDDPRLRLFAAATAPSLKRHLDLVKAVRSH